MAEKQKGKASAKVLAQVLRNTQGAMGPKDAATRLHDLRPLQPSAEYVAAANQALGRTTPGMNGDTYLGGGYDIMEQTRPPTLDATGAVPMLAAPAEPSAEYVARVAQLMGRPGMGPQTVALGAELEREARPTPLWKSQQRKAPQFQGAVASGEAAVDPRMLAAMLRAGR